MRVAVMAALLAPMVCGVVTPAGGVDRHAGFYYPEPQSREDYQARSKPLPDANRRKRVDFVNGLTAQMLASPYPPQFAVFPKGDEAEKLIIVSLHDHSYNTLYRARALLAMLTAVSRQTPLFQKMKVDDVFTFFDLLVLLGFKRLTISDGDTFAHQVAFK
jgi:hypothetical protein